MANTFDWLGFNVIEDGRVPPGVDPLLLTGRVEVGATITHEFTDAEAYDRFVRGTLERSPVRATFEAHFPPRPREHRVCLWGWREGYVQAGSPEDRHEELLAGGELHVVVPAVEYARDRSVLAGGREPDHVQFRAVDEAWREP